MKPIFKQNTSFKQLCQQLIRDESGIWHCEQSGPCHYPEDGAERLGPIESDSFWFRHRHNCIIEMIKHFPPEDLIIDMGGGNGFITLGLKEAGFNPVLLEPDKTAAANARQRGIEQIICSTVEDLKIAHNSISAVGLFDVLEHIQDDSLFLNEIKNILKPKGRLFLTVPAFQYLWSYEDLYANHFRRYKGNRLVAQLKECGFVVDYKSYLFSYLIAPLYLLKALPTKFNYSKTYTHEQTRNEHVIQPGLKKNIIDNLNSWEQNRIRKGGSIPFGTSVMIAAHAS